MCSTLLDKLTALRDECRAGQWSMINGVEYSILVNIFSSGEATVKRIVEALNLLSLVDKSRAVQCVQVAKEIIGLQGGVQTDDTESIYLIDLQRALSKILSVKANELLQNAVDNARSHFGITATRIRYAAVKLDDIDGTFNDPDFSSSLMLQPPLLPPQSTTALTAAEIGAPRTSSSAEHTETIENDWNRIGSTDSDFYRKLRDWK